MKILLATVQYGRGYSQGTERYLSILREGLRGRGHEAIVLAGDPERRGDAQPLGSALPGETDILAAGRTHWAAVEGELPARYDALLREQCPDLVHMVNPAHIGLGPVHAARQRGIPVIATTMDYWWICPKQTLQHYGGGICAGSRPWRECAACVAADHSPALHRCAKLPQPLRTMTTAPILLGRMLQRGLSIAEIRHWTARQNYIDAALQAMHTVIFPSKTILSLVGSRLRGPVLANIAYGLEAYWFTKPAASRPRPRSPTDATIGFAGALQPHKGPQLVIAALYQLGWTQTRVRIAGGGDAAFVESLKRSAIGLNVEFVGRVAPPEMPAFMRSVDAMIVPSTWPENLPFVVLEAHASGTTVIASDVSGIAEIVPDRGLLFPVGSADGLARSLRYWLDAAPLVAPPRVCTAREMVDATLACYEAACSAPTT